MDNLLNGFKTIKIDRKPRTHEAVKQRANILGKVLNQNGWNLTPAVIEAVSKETGWKKVTIQNMTRELVRAAESGKYESIDHYFDSGREFNVASKKF